MKATDNKKTGQVWQRQEASKKLIIEELTKTPIIEIACKKANVGRATYYRWCKGDTEFTDQARESIMGGKLLINDMAESQLISAIKDQKLPAIIFWLKANHPDYTSKLEVTGKIKSENAPLTPEQEQAIMRAIELADSTDQHLINNP